MPLENRNLEAGTRLAARYKGQQRTCEVVQTDDGLRYKTDDGELFQSPSSAAKHVMGGIAANGWRFWSLEGELKEKREPKAKRAPKAKAAAKTAAKAKSAKKSGKAKAKKPAKAHSAKSRDSYGCGACGADFPTQKAAIEHALTHTS